MQRLGVDYCHGADERDLIRFLSVWHPDATWDVGGPTFTGHAEIRWAIERQWESLARGHHWSTGLEVEVDGDSAVGRSVAHALTRGSDGTWRLSVGEYADLYARRDGRWAILRRTATVTSSTVLAPRPETGLPTRGGGAEDG